MIRKPPHRSMRPVRTVLLSASLGLALLVAPWESGLLPSTVPDLAGKKATAQTPPPPAVDSGTPTDCLTTPTQWSPQGSECVLELPACPQSPLFQDFPDRQQFMRLSVPPAGLEDRFPSLDVGYPDVDGLVGYPDFCEERVLDSDPAYGACLGMSGSVVTQYTDPDTSQMGCRLLHPIECPVGLYMASSKTCRAVQRRTWTCEDGQVPRNEFNSCYKLPESAPDQHPACGEGSPDFVAMACEDYVGGDYIANPADVACVTTYMTGTPVNNAEGDTAVPGARSVPIAANSHPGESSAHWCSYDSRYLDARCHRTNLNPVPDVCTTESLALCLKRASQTGGCDAIATTIRCRAYEAAYRQRVRRGNMRVRAVQLEEVRLQGCTPCIILPFTPVPGACPDDTDAEPRRGRWNGLTINGQRQYHRTPADLVSIHEDEAGFGTTEPACADPPRGSVTWESAHISGVAVVNSPIIVTIPDTRLSDPPSPAYSYWDSETSPIYWASSTRRVVRMADSSEDPRVRTRPDVDSTTTFGTLSEMVSRECAVSQPPFFKLVVEELWPDNGPDYDDSDGDCTVPPDGDRPDSNAEAILQLFGADSLRWWCELTGGERRDRTRARGLDWWDDPDTDQDGRTERLREKFNCDYTTTGDLIWCRWVPTRAGYYRLEAAGAWLLTTYTREPARFRLDELLAWLNDPQDGTGNRSSVQNQLNSAGLGHEDIGLDSTLTSALPTPPGSDWMYSESVGSNANCPAVDLRIYCNREAIGRYTQTDPVGVRVHEVRAHTVTPSR